MNLQDATTRVRKAIEVITPEFDPHPPPALVELCERVPGVFDVLLTDDDYLAAIHEVTVRHVLGAQSGTISHEAGPMSGATKIPRRTRAANRRRPDG